MAQQKRNCCKSSGGGGGGAGGAGGAGSGKLANLAAASAAEASEAFAGCWLLPHVLYFTIHGLGKLNFKACFWGLILLAAFLGSLGSAVLIVIGALFAILASYNRPQGPFPASEQTLDVLFGRSNRVSRMDPEHLHANNNVSICSFRGQYVLAYRKSDIHFPSAASRLVVATSTDLRNWEEPWEYHTGNDLREMLLFEIGGRLRLYFFALIPNNRVFKPIHMYCTTSEDAKVWSEPVQVCRRREVPWDIKVYSDDNGTEVAYKASYLGDHYGTEEVNVLFERSYDGLTWEAVGEDPVVYSGGICEVAFEFTSKGDLVAIGRNEDGDHTGFGSQLFFAEKGNLGKWTPLRFSMPWRFDSPRMLRTDGGSGEIILFARYAAERYDLAPSWLEFGSQKLLNLLLYSTLPKSAAVFRIAPPEEWARDASESSSATKGGEPGSPFAGGREGTKAVQFIRFFEQAFGDTGFFSVARDLQAGPDHWVVANYSASRCHSHAPWIYGQLSRTDVHVCRCRVVH